MSAALWLVVFAASLVGGMFLGVYVGRAWGSLPSARVGSVVKFRGQQFGLEIHMVIEEMRSDRDSFVMVLSQRRKVRRTEATS